MFVVVYSSTFFAKMVSFFFLLEAQQFVIAVFSCSFLIPFIIKISYLVKEENKTTKANKPGYIPHCGD